jgi:cytochrome c
MRKVQLSISLLLAGAVFATGAVAADAAPAATVAPVAAPAAALADAAPAAAEAASAPVAAAPVAAEPPKPEVLSDEDGMALLKKSTCLVCHSFEKKIIGPAYKDVAAKYRGQADAEDKLVAKVKKGGKGVWGSAAMPPQGAKTEDVRSLVRFVLSK